MSTLARVLEAASELPNEEQDALIIACERTHNLEWIGRTTWNSETESQIP